MLHWCGLGHPQVLFCLWVTILQILSRGTTSVLRCSHKGFRRRRSLKPGPNWGKFCPTTSRSTHHGPACFRLRLKECRGALPDVCCHYFGQHLWPLTGFHQTCCWSDCWMEIIHLHSSCRENYTQQDCNSCNHCRKHWPQINVVFFLNCLAAFWKDWHKIETFELFSESRQLW